MTKSEHENLTRENCSRLTKALFSWEHLHSHLLWAHPKGDKEKYSQDLQTLFLALIKDTPLALVLLLLSLPLSESLILGLFQQPSLYWAFATVNPSSSGDTWKLRMTDTKGAGRFLISNLFDLLMPSETTLASPSISSSYCSYIKNEVNANTSAAFSFQTDNNVNSNKSLIDSGNSILLLFSYLHQSPLSGIARRSTSENRGE